MQGHTSNLQLLKKQLDRTFKKEKDRQKAHATSSKILEDLSTNNTLLSEIFRSNLNKKNFFSQEHYPVLAFPICANEHYELIANVWIPLASKSTEYSTKSIHHHGPMLLTTVTAFGPGYFHYLFDRPVRDESKSNVFSMKVLAANQHERSTSLFVDQYLPHCPMYPEKLSITYALWSNSIQKQLLSRVKRLPLLRQHSTLLRQIGKKIGLTKALDLKLETYLDYYPANDHFCGVKEREEVEFKKGPISDRASSIINLLQETKNEDLLSLCEKDLLANQSLGEQIKERCLNLVSKAKAGTEIESRISDEVHFGFEKANFTHDQIKASL